MAPQIFFRTKEQHAAVTERLQIMKDDFAECEYSAEALEGNGKKMVKPIAAGLVVLRVPPDAQVRLRAAAGGHGANWRARTPKVPQFTGSVATLRF